MPFEIKWYVPYRVIDTYLTGHVNSEEMKQIAQEFVNMLTEGQVHMPGKQLYLLYDTTDAESIPPTYLMLKQALPILRFKNRGPMFHITRSNTFRSISELTAHISKFQLQIFATRAEALQALEKTMLHDDFRLTGQ